MPKVNWRPAVQADADLVFRMTEACMREYAERMWGRWEADGIRADFTPETHRILVHEGCEIGCVAIEDNGDHYRLAKLYVMPAWQNRGIGTEVLRALQDESGGRPIRLSVLVVNPARRFYERNGFVLMRSTPERHFMEWRDGARLTPT